MIVFSIVLGFVAAALLVGFILTAIAPMGYQDEAGFHYGPLEGERENQTPLAIPEPKTV